MGSIIGSKVRDDGKIVFEVCVDLKEASNLKGQVEDIYLIATGVESEKTSVVQRGTNESTMYLLIPKSAREELKKDEIALFQKLDFPRRKIYVYSVKK